MNPKVNIAVDARLATLPIGGIIGQAGVLMRGPHGAPLVDVDGWAEALLSAAFLHAHLAILLIRLERVDLRWPMIAAGADRRGVA